MLKPSAAKRQDFSAERTLHPPLMTVPALPFEAQPPGLVWYRKDMARRKKMAPRDRRGKKSGGGSGRRHSLPSPSSPTRVHTHCRSEGRALRASPAPPAGSAHAGRPAQSAEKGDRPEVHLQPLCRSVRGWGCERPRVRIRGAESLHIARPGDPCLSEPPQLSAHYLLSGTALLASRCQARAGGRATKVTAPGPLPNSPIPLPAPKCPLRVSEGGKRGGRWATALNQGQRKAPLELLPRR